jgi:hypothetical protein
VESIVTLITELGSFGLLLALAGFIIYNYVKNQQQAKPMAQSGNGVNDITIIKTLLEENTKDIKNSIDSQSKRIDNIERTFGTQINSINTRLDDMERSGNKASQHTKQFKDRLKLGPQLHKTLNTFRNRINADHIFIGSFHNGNESLTGIPYYKFDIIAERFRPDKVDNDIEFAFMYKDADLLRHDLLPTEVVQRGTVKYIIDEDGNSDLQDIDDIIYRRMIGRGIKQLAVSLLRDPAGTPSGFVGCVRYDYEDMDIEELRACGDELETVYATNDKLIMNK